METDSTSIATETVWAVLTLVNHAPVALFARLAHRTQSYQEAGAPATAAIPSSTESACCATEPVTGASARTPTNVPTVGMLTIDSSMVCACAEITSTEIPTSTAKAATLAATLAQGLHPTNVSRATQMLSSKVRLLVCAMLGTMERMQERVLPAIILVEPVQLPVRINVPHVSHSQITVQQQTPVLAEQDTIEIQTEIAKDAISPAGTVQAPTQVIAQNVEATQLLLLLLLLSNVCAPVNHTIQMPTASLAQPLAELVSELRATSV